MDTSFILVHLPEIKHGFLMFESHNFGLAHGVGYQCDILLITFV